MTICKLTKDSIVAIEPTTFSAIGVSERYDLQRVLRENIAVIDPSILIISEEFCQWEDSQRRVDLLGIDSSARVVVIELKRTEDGGHMELQALRYAAMASTLTFEQACDIYESYLAKRASDLDPRDRLLNHLGWESSEDNELEREPRIVLVSAEFSKELTTSVIWLCEHEIDIRCVRIKPYTHDGHWYVDVQQLIPLPEAAEYITKVRDKKQIQDQKQKKSYDLTRFCITIGQERFEKQVKRRAMLLVLQALVKRGIHPTKIDDAVSWRRIFYKVPPALGDEPVSERLGREYNVAQPNKVWFLEDAEQLVVHDGETYAIAKHWGKKTEKALKALMDEFKPSDIRYEVES